MTNQTIINTTNQSKNLNTNPNKFISNFEQFTKQILNQNKTKISKLNPKYKILSTTDIENYFLQNIDKFEIKSIEIKNNQITISKNITKAILQYKQQNKILTQFQEITFDNQTAKFDLMKIFVEYEKYKNKNNFIDNEDIYQILFEHFIKNKTQLEELKNINNKHLNYQISEKIINNLTPNKLQLLKLFDIKQAEIIQKEKQENKEIQENKKNIIIHAKSNTAQNSFILEKISDLKEQNTPKTSFGIITNTSTNKLEIQKFLQSYDINLETFSSENLFEEDSITYLTNILKTIQNPKGANNECFYILDKLNIREETKRKITRKASRAEKSIFKVLEKEEEFSDFNDENKLIIELKENLKNLNEIKSTGTNILNLILNTIKTFKLYENLTCLISKENNILTNVSFDNSLGISDSLNQIFCINEFIKFTKHFEELYKTNSLDKFLLYLESSNSNTYKFNTLTHNLTNIYILTAEELNNNLQNFDYIFFTNLNHTKYPIFQIKNLFDNETFDTREQDFNKQKQIFDKIIKQTKIKNYLITVDKNPNGISQKKSKILETPEFDHTEKKPYTKEIELFKISKNDKIKQKSIKKISELILSDKFDLAKSELEILKLTFGKKDLTSFMSKHSPHELSTDKFNDIDTSKLVYSVSQLQTYESCPKKYMFNYIYKIPSRPRHYFDFGTSVHESLEFLSADFDKKLPIEKLYTLGVKYLTDGWISKGYENANQEQEYFQKGLNIIKEFIVKETELRMEDRQTIGLELKFFLDFEGRTLMGYIDRIDKVNGEIEILDYKTSKSMSRESELEKNMQLLVYSLASESHQDIKKFPKSVGLWYVLHDKIVKISPKKEYTVEIKKRVIEQIKKIENKNFKATPSKFGCTYCDFNQICNDSIADKIIK
jgi:CRISPR/Cas system-associated exonuclease Cas4 (RecB family)